MISHAGMHTETHFSTINLQDKNDMILVPDVVHGIRLEASLDEIQRIDYVLYCL
jgi:hypothetical protein